MVKLKCKRCGKEWEYTGEKKWYTTCPDCKTSVKIKDYNSKKEKGGNENDKRS